MHEYADIRIGRRESYFYFLAPNTSEVRMFRKVPFNETLLPNLRRKI